MSMGKNDAEISDILKNQVGEKNKLIWLSASIKSPANGRYPRG